MDSTWPLSSRISVRDRETVWLARPTEARSTLRDPTAAETAMPRGRSPILAVAVSAAMWRCSAAGAQRWWKRPRQVLYVTHSAAAVSAKHGHTGSCHSTRCW